MTDLTRRTMLGAAAAAAAAPLAATSSAAAAPPAGKQVPSYYRYKIGDYELTTILDGVRQVKLDVSPIRNAKLEDVQAVLAASYLPKDQVGYYFHPTVVNTGSKLVLIDTGNGPGLQTGTGMTPANLAAAGIDPKTIDIVVISHFHGDHISGLRTADGALAYPNAEIKVPAKEWAYWTEEGNASRAPQGQQPTFQNTKRIFGPIADKVTKYEWGKEVAPVSWRRTPMATPPATPRSWWRRAPARCSFRPTSPPATRRWWSPTRPGRWAATWTARRPKQRGASSMTCWRPTACWSRAITSRSPIARLYREGGQRLSPDPGELESGALRRGFCLNSAVGPSRDKPGDGPDRCSRRLAASGHGLTDARRRYGARA